MGVQILNKDVSLISSIIGKAKANIANVGGITGWAGGGDVTLNPTPDWGGYWIQPAAPIYTNTEQMLGIDVTVTLSINVLFKDGGTLSVGVNNTNTYGGTITTYTTEPALFTVNVNDYVTFKWEPDYFGSAVGFDIRNVSDGDIPLSGTIYMYQD